MLLAEEVPDQNAYRKFVMLIQLLQTRFGTTPIEGVEIGTMRGESAFYLLRELPNVQHLYTVDPWAYVPNSTMEQARPHDFHESNYYQTLERLQPLKARVTIVRDFSDDFFTYCIARQKQFDFLYIDGHHEAFQVDRDLQHAKQVLKPGGFLCGDDYVDCPGVAAQVHAHFGAARICVDRPSQIWWLV